MVLKLYGSYHSPWVRLVAAVLKEKQVPYELVAVNFANGENKTPEYLDKHPFGQIPYIDDDGFILYESRAICYYIAAKYPDQGTPLLPTGLQANALYQQAVFVEASHFHGHAFAAAREIFYSQRKGVPHDQSVVDKNVADLSVKLDAYDKILSKQKYLAGNELTLVDFYHLPIGTALGKVGINIIDTKPNVAKWLKEISSRESWVSTEVKAP
jgi:glutathione S-transferase